MNALENFDWAAWRCTCAKVSVYLEACDEMLQESDFTSVLEFLPHDFRFIDLTGRDDNDGVNRDSLMTLVRILPVIKFTDYVVVGHTWKQKPGTGLYPSIALFKNGERVILTCAANFVWMKYASQPEGEVRYKTHHVTEHSLHDIECAKEVVNLAIEMFAC